MVVGVDPYHNIVSSNPGFTDYLYPAAHASTPTKKLWYINYATSPGVV